MELKAGPISGNPMAGLCQRMVVEVKQVFDGCVTRLQNENLILSLSDYSPGSAAPYSYLHAESSGNTVINNIVITPTSNRRSRISADITCPVTVYYNDANGNPGTAHADYTTHRDVVLNLPEPTLAHYTIEAATALVSSVGAFTGDTSVNIGCCIVQTIKVVINVDVLIPVYNYANYPTCTDLNENLCRGMFNLPLFPANRY